MGSEKEIADAIRQLAEEMQRDRIEREEHSGETYTMTFKDRGQAVLAWRAIELYSALHDIDQKCRGTLKYRESENVELDTFAEEIRSDIWGTGLMDMVE